MIIQHNIMALNSYRQLGTNNNALAKNLEKLSSGYKINRAGDDAAGLAISEKMRAQLKGLETAQKNAYDGISLIQTAEGALTEVHSMLNRMVELTTQASNGIYDDKIDRRALDDEFQQLKDEINRISKATNFNGISLLDGSLSSNAVQGSNAVNPNAIRFIDDFDKDVLKISKGARVEADATHYKIEQGVSATTGNFESANSNIRDFKDAMVKAGVIKSDDTALSKWKTAIADYFGIDEADYDIEISVNGTLSTGTVVTTFGDNAADSITLKAKQTGATDPNRDQILTKGNSFVKISQEGADAYNRIDIIVGDKAADSSLVGKKIEINGKTYTFLGDNDYLDKANGVTATASVSGEKLADGSYSINIAELNSATVAPDKAQYIAQQIVNAVRNVEGTFLAAGGDTKWKADGKLNLASGTGIYIDKPTSGNPASNSIDNASITFAPTAWDKTNATTTANPASGKLSIDPTKFAQTTSNNVATSGGLKLQIGDSADDYNIMTVGINDMSTKGLGIANLGISTYADAKAVLGTLDQQGSVGTIKGAINAVSTQRAALGALQNRLEHTISNIGVTAENVTAAESRIRDTDMAKEMMAYTKNNILVQAAQAMLAQANMVPQGVLQLIR